MHQYAKELRQEAGGSPHGPAVAPATEEENPPKRRKVWTVVFMWSLSDAAAIVNSGAESPRFALSSANRQPINSPLVELNYILLPGHHQQHHEQQLHDELYGHQWHASDEQEYLGDEFESSGLTLL
ncbi:MAG: hypothetical protein ACLU9S_22685 [Oscillospiraceae bacterium]